MADAVGAVTHFARYTPWGDTLETYGTGRFTQGYFGGITLAPPARAGVDAATGLIYVGNGQYYDPATGRFLTRDARPNQNNPYTPIDPTGAMLGPLALLAMVFGRKKSRGKWDTLVILLVLGVSVGVGLAACGKPGTPAPEIVKATATLTSTATKVRVEDGEGNVLGTYQAPVGFPSNTPTPCIEIIATLTRTPTPMPIDETPSGLSSKKNIEGFDAYDMYNLFKAYKQFVKKKRDHTLTEREFLGLMIYRDGLSSGQLYANEYVKDKIVWAVTVQLWSGHRQYYCLDENCLGGLFNFIASYIDSAWEEYKSVIQKGREPDFMGMVGYFNAIDAGRIIGDAVVDPKDTSRKVYTLDVPLDWGNPFDPKGAPTETLWWLKIFDYQSPVRGSEYNKIYYFDKTANFVIHSDNQRSYWVSQCLQHEQCKKNKPK